MKKVMSTILMCVILLSVCAGCKTSAQLSVPPSSSTSPYSYSVISEKYIMGNLVIDYPQLSGFQRFGSTDEITQHDTNVSLFSNALLSMGSYIFSGSKLSATITYQVVYQKSKILSVRYFGTGSIPDPPKGVKNPIQFRHGTTVDVSTGKQLYLSDIFNISDHFIKAFITHGKQDIPDVLGRSSSASYGGSDVSIILNQTGQNSTLSFYLNGDSLVILAPMADDQLYPATIPMSEISQDLKSSYKDALA